MFSLFIFLAQFSLYSSQSTYCGWTVIDDELQPLDVCQQEKGSGQTNLMSYMLSCNSNNERIEAKWWHNSDTCDMNIEQPIITYPISSNFNCNDTQCSSSYVTYRTYLNNECVSAGHVITDASIISDAAHANAPFRETTLITNTCHNYTTSEYHQVITCTNNSYSIHSYLDASCTQLLSTDMIRNTDCEEISFCSDDISITLSTTSYFTTTEAETHCNFINNIGFNIPTEKCMTMSAKESQKYECNEKGNIEWSYYSTSKCEGDALYTFPYPSSGILDMNCNTHTCIDSEYMELITYATEGDCSADVIEESDYESHLYLLDTCMTTRRGGGIMYQCTNSNDDTQQHGGYTVTKYADSQCMTQDGDAMLYSDVECIEESQRRQHMVFCNGVNNIVIPSNDSISYIMDCNYFVNHHMDSLGLIGEPLDVCMLMQHGQYIYSKRYQCNATRNGIEEIVYTGEDCVEDNVEFTVARPEFTEFCCESSNECGELLIGKQYTNDTCDERNNEFWYSQYIILDACWPIGSDLYAMVSCDVNGFIYHSLYNDDKCTADGLVSHSRFDADVDCIYGKVFETVHCPYWKESNESVSTTAQPIMTTTSIAVETTDVTVETTEIVTGITRTDIAIETTEYVALSSTVGIHQSSTTATTTERETETATTEMIFTTDGGQGWEGKREIDEECTNVFGGHDAQGMSCKKWETVIWCLIFAVVALMVGLIMYCLCSHDTKSLRRSISGGASLKRRGSKLHISNGNNNDDLDDIVVQQLNKGQLSQAPGMDKDQAIQKVQEAGDDDKSDDPQFDI